jgi:Sec-independent protein translocase protein TatA
MDILLILIVILVVVVVWRGPKTLPKLGAAFGRGVKEARREIDEARGEPAEAGEAGDRSKDDPTD